MSQAPKLRPEFDTPQFAKGLEVRRDVLGADYVDNSLAPPPTSWPISRSW